jgi:hypothetical protein
VCLVEGVGRPTQRGQQAEPGGPATDTHDVVDVRRLCRRRRRREPATLGARCDLPACAAHADRRPCGGRHRGWYVRRRRDKVGEMSECVGWAMGRHDHGPGLSWSRALYNCNIGTLCCGNPNDVNEILPVVYFGSRILFQWDTHLDFRPFPAFTPPYHQDERSGC